MYEPEAIQEETPAATPPEEGTPEESLEAAPAEEAA